MNNVMNTIVSFKDVSKFYNRAHILKNISFDMGKKDVVGLIGPNGAGKTTIMRLILGSVQPSSGVVEVFGDADRGEVRPANRDIGFVLDRHGFNLKESAENNILFYSQLYNVKKSEARARMEKMVDALGLEINIKAPLNTYSKGMLQQVSIIKSLIHKPRLLILDEPATGLDPAMQAVIQNLIGNLSDIYDITVLVSSHNLKELEKVCNKFIIINKGELKLFTDKALAGPGSQYKAVFSLVPGSGGVNTDFIKPLLDLDLFSQYRLANDTLECQLDDPKQAYHIHGWFEENNVHVSQSQVRTTDIEDVYFEIIGEDRHVENANIY